MRVPDWLRRRLAGVVARWEVESCTWMLTTKATTGAKYTIEQ